MKSSRLSVKVVATLLTVVVVLAVLEVASRLLSPSQPDVFGPARADIYKRIYSPEEMDRSRPFQLPRQGGDCLTYRLDKLYWNQWWGYSAKALDVACAKRLFDAHPIRVALFGGSAMFNAEAPNHLTHIDYLAFKDDARIASVNLAESGARLSNMVARFIHEGLALKPDVAVFLDGFNEFNSVRYGGEPGHDFYWTAGVSRRIERPWSVLVDKLVETSGLARVLLVHTGLVRSARLPRLAGPPSPLPDVQAYRRDRDVLRALCRHYDIACVFIIQPVAFVTAGGNGSATWAVSAHATFFPFDAPLFRAGYELLRRDACDDCIDASGLFDGVEDSYFDVVHFTKVGGAKLATLIHRSVSTAYERRAGRTSQRGQ